MLATLVATAALAFGSASPPIAPPVATAARSCRGAYARHGSARRAHAVRCLINAARARRGLPRLRASRALTRAARRHARDMVRRGFFSHVSPGGSTPTTRARSAGYRSAAVGETIAFGSGFAGTPASTVSRWLRSPPHAAVIYSASLREMGVGVASGSPLRGRGGTTVSADFGRR